MKPKEDIKTIFEAALNVFAEYGYKKSTVEDIASRLGMTKGALYIYVKNKKDLYEKTVAFALRRWQGKVRDAVASENDVVDRFLVMCSKAVEYLSTDDDLRRVLVRDPDIFPMFPSIDPYRDVNDDSVGMIRAILTEGVEQGRFRPVDIDRTADVIFSIYKMLIIRTYIHSEQEAVRSLYGDAIELLTNGLFIPADEPPGD